MSPDDAREAVLLALVHLSQSRNEYDADQRAASFELALSIAARRTFTIGKDIA